MAPLRVGVLDVLALPARRPTQWLYDLFLSRLFASITPQVISVWCRRLGHETFYSTYYGVGDPGRRLPDDLDIVFLSAYTQASPLAYALARRYRRAGVTTVLGGPHARCFPGDSLRFFDLVVDQCDEELVADILAGRFAPGSLVSSDRPFREVPPVAERLPEIRAGCLIAQRWGRTVSTVPMLASTGCPYACDFCVDWNNPYRQLPLEQLEGDLRALSRELPGAVVAFQDPNFAVRFDAVLDVLESVPADSRPPYVAESSLSILRGPRMGRLAATNCLMMAPGVESWGAFSRKAGVGRKTGREKVVDVADHFRELHRHVPYLQANFVFGLDSDAGDEPVELTREFMQRTPIAWPAINIPVPFGGTPLYDRHRLEGRILTRMPFAFYYAPYLVTIPKHYDPIGFYERLVRLFEFASSPSMLRSRLEATPSRALRFTHRLRTASVRTDLHEYRGMLRRLREDPQFRAFHEGRSPSLPDFYRARCARLLGRYAGLLSPDDWNPRFDEEEPPGAASTPGRRTAYERRLARSGRPVKGAHGERAGLTRPPASPPPPAPSLPSAPRGLGARRS